MARAQQKNRRQPQEQILAGTTAVEGPGIEIRIQDPAGNVTADLLLDAVEELRDAGAYALVRTPEALSALLSDA